MKFIDSRIELIEQKPGIAGMMQHIELAGRVAYKSEDRITDDSAEEFVKMLISRGHTACLEQGTVYLTIPSVALDMDTIVFLSNNPYTRIAEDKDTGGLKVTTNYRVLLENNNLDLLEYWSEPDEHIRRYTIRFICSRGVSHELVRHRVFSFVQESTRYCNYSKDKHDNELKFIIPVGVTDIKDGDVYTVNDVTPQKFLELTMGGTLAPTSAMLIGANVASEQVYMEMLKAGWTPQRARDVLTNGLKTEVVMTGFDDQWVGFLDLRSYAFGARGMHPDMGKLGDLVFETLEPLVHFNMEVDA